MAAFGTTIREEQFSISANIWIDSPRGKKNMYLLLNKNKNNQTSKNVDS